MVKRNFCIPHLVQIVHNCTYFTYCPYATCCITATLDIHSVHMLQKILYASHMLRVLYISCVLYIMHIQHFTYIHIVHFLQTVRILQIVISGMTFAWMVLGVCCICFVRTGGLLFFCPMRSSKENCYPRKPSYSHSNSQEGQRAHRMRWWAMS